MASFGKRSGAATSAAGGGKRPAAAESIPAKAPAISGKKRVALGDISNAGRAPAKSGMKTHPIITSSTKRAAPTATTIRNSISSRRTSLTPSVSKKSIPRTTNSTNGTTVGTATSAKPSLSSTNGTNSTAPVTRKSGSGTSNGTVPNSITVLVPCRSVAQQDDSVSVDETMSMCDSMKSPDFEYIDNADSNANLVASLERRANANLRISDDITTVELKRKGIVLTEMEVQNVDKDYEDPQMCTALACDIYKHLRIAETKKRPSTDFMETVQTDVNPSMRAILVDWLVEVAEEYRLVPDTLYLTVNYIDRYLSGNEINRQRLQLLGVACMLIASKYEEICAPQVEEFCYITDNTYFKDEVLQMETQVLNYLKFEMTAPTAKCFLRRFVRAAQLCEEAPILQLEFLASYIAELSLLEYNLLSYSPSHIAAASIFLAKFILHPTKNPWSATLSHYTLYKPSVLRECVESLHRLFCNGPASNLPAVREKYSQHKYKFVAKKYCPSAIPGEYFRDV